MPAFVNNLQEKVDCDANLGELIEKVVETVLKTSEFPNAEVSVVLVDNEYIREMNNQYRGIDKPTDVLSFALLEGEEEEVPYEENELLLGDIIISLERAQEQADEYGHSFSREVAYLTAHGMFHLLGYDHNSEEEREIMRQKEEQVLEKLDLTR